MIPNHLYEGVNKYIDIVQKASHKYGVDESLILAIIEIESSFNPYAISNCDALGLMQIVQDSAGKDVFQSQGKSGIPSRSYLFNPITNIDTGTAYISMLLNNIYLSKIEDSVSRRYAVITAYNSGVNNVLRVFSNDKIKAVNVINKMSSEDVYKTLINCHPSIESRHYLHKVNAIQRELSKNYHNEH